MCVVQLFWLWARRIMWYGMYSPCLLSYSLMMEIRFSWINVKESMVLLVVRFVWLSKSWWNDWRYIVSLNESVIQWGDLFLKGASCGINLVFRICIRRMWYNPKPSFSTIECSKIYFISTSKSCEEWNRIGFSSL